MPAAAMIGDYTLAAIVAPASAASLEALLRTGLLRTARFWATMAITLAFQVPADGWLTKLSAPIVIYRPGAISGLRWPWDIPVEDFGFGFALVTVTLLVWERARRRSASTPARQTAPGEEAQRRSA
jgi:lycopene cyclase domain-containing protein